MPKVKMFAVYDSKIGAFMQPFSAEHAGQALRMWDQLVNDGKSNVSTYPEDFSIFEIGTFDEDKGMVQSLTAPVQLQSALETKRPISRQPEVPSL